MQKDIYVFSGLGVDERVLKHLSFGVDNKVTFIKWITPEVHEKMEDYAKRLSTQINSDNPILVGLSFGGMMAIEVAKLIETQKVILLASAKNRNEIPFYFRLAGMLKLYKLIPISFLKTSNRVTNFLFGAKTKSDKNLLREILIETDAIFLKWAIEVIVKWTNTTTVSNTFHIHGNRDFILPIYFTKNDFTIHGGGHFMTLNKFQEINSILLRLITN